MIPGSATPFLLAKSADGDYKIERSLRFNSSDSSHLSRTPSSEGNRKTWTWSAWIKRAKLGTGQRVFTGASSTADANWTAIHFISDKLYISGYNTHYRISNRVFRDPGAWFHLVVKYELGASAEADKIKAWCNGEEITWATSNTAPSTSGINTANNHTLGSEQSPNNGALNSYCDLYLAEVHFIDGQALAATDFGEYDDNGVWQPIKFSGNYNTEATANNPTSTSNVAPSGGYGNTIPSADLLFSASGPTSATSHLRQDGGGMEWSPAISLTGSDVAGVFCTYFNNSLASFNIEFKIDGSWVTAQSNAGTVIGTTQEQGALITLATTGSWTGVRVTGGSNVSVSGITGIYKNGTRLNNGSSNGFYLDFSDNSSNAALGFDAAVTQPTLNPRGGMDVITYTGNASTRTIGGLAFQPDLVWIKNRDSASSHFLHDSVRGFSNGNAYELRTDGTNVEGVPGTASSGLTSFNSDGFSLGSDGGTNANSDSFVAWAWKAGGSAVSNTDGTITSQVSANADYGFSIVTWTAASNTTNSIGHGLNAAPKLIFTKSRSNANNWRVYTATGGKDKYLGLNATDAETSFSNFWSTSEPTSSTFGVWNATGAANNDGDMIAYCWSEVSGFSKFGSYTGTGATGHKITTGFKPGWILFKRTDAVSNWRIVDRERGNFSLNAETTEAQQTLNFAIEDDGFTINETGNNPNASGGTYIYACFADRPGNNWSTNNLIAAAGLETATQGMDVVTYTGTGSNQTISGLNFQPDLIWCKTRSNAVDHKLVDSVRGLTNVLEANQDRVESTGISNGITALNSDGFTVGSSGDFNSSGRTYVAWCWKAGGTATSNTDGSITSSVSANTTYGFSIANYQGTGANATVGHGLGKAPGFIIIKNRDTERGDAWRVWHKSLAANERMVLSGTNTVGSAPTQWQNTLPSSSVFYLDNDNRYNSTGDDHIAYCWAEIPGFSKFGSYSGSSSTVTVTTGFKPTYILIKCTDASGQEWIIKTSDLGGGNYLQAQSSAVETSGRNLTFNVDGFSVTGGQGPTNYSGRNYIYAAFADKPPGEIIDSLIDTPKDYTATSGNNGGNYCTWNPIDSTGTNTLANGNLDCSGAQRGNRGTIAVTSGKYYYETIITSFGVGGDFGWSKSDEPCPTTDPGANSYGWSVHTSGLKRHAGSTSSYISGGLAVNDVIQFAIDVDAGKVWFGKNNTWGGSGDPATGTNAAFTNVTGPIAPAHGNGGSAIAFTTNFGQRPFTYTPPSGYKSLCTTNLTEPTIADGSTAMDVALWTGTGATRSITGLGFSPDFVWIKKRSGTTAHNLFDIVRGANKPLFSNLTSAELSDGRLTAFNSDGFTLDSDNAVNDNNQTHVGWAWDAGTSNTTVAVDANGSGLPGAACEYRVNTTTGFSIVKVASPTSTEARVHGLNKKPDLIICKSTGDGDSWHTYHSSLGYTKYINLNGTGPASSSDQFGSQEPTSTYFYVKPNTGSGANKSGGMIYYIWTAVEGYSAFGSYTGNSSADGPFVYTGFRPAFIVCKRSSGSSPWNMFDSARSPFNVVDEGLLAESANAEFTGTDRVDFLSNGFKLKAPSGAEPNVNGQTYIYMAFAEHPFKTARAR